jgi:hypothetical protein
MVTKTVNHPRSWAPTPLNVEDRLTYDAGKSRWVDITIGERGLYGASYSSGWQGNKQSIQPVDFNSSVTSGNVVSAGETVLTKVSDTEYTYTGSFKEKAGRTVTSKGSCKKS